MEISASPNGKTSPLHSGSGKGGAVVVASPPVARWLPVGGLDRRTETVARPGCGVSVVLVEAGMSRRPRRRPGSLSAHHAARPGCRAPVAVRGRCVVSCECGCATRGSWLVRVCCARRGGQPHCPANRPGRRRLARDGPASTCVDRDAAAPGLSRKMSRSEARTAPLASPCPPPPPTAPSMAASSMPFSAENWPTITPFKDGETRVASDSEFGDFTTLLVICPDDSTGIELNPQPTAPLPREGFGMNLCLTPSKASTT